jgi:V-type H+-transporting ATPase subunit H
MIYNFARLGQGKLPNGAAPVVAAFLEADDQAQRAQLDDIARPKDNIHLLIRAFFQIISDNSRDQDLIFYSLIHLDGILEDKRSRVKYFVEVMNDFKNKVDLPGILVSFMRRSASVNHRDIASHILALIIDAEKQYDNVAKHAKDFLNMVTNPSVDSNNELLSPHAQSFAIMTLVKTNQLAREFSNVLGFNILSKYLDGPCLQNAQIAYHVISALWILSFHEFAHSFFEDYTQGIIEKVSKVLDYFSWEKIVRIMLMLFENLKTNAVCQEHLSDIDCLSIVFKLQNRHWVDDDINKLLEALEEFFQENHQQFSSIDKLRKQVDRVQLRWGPVHTEEFWQLNCIQFDNAENLSIIDKLANDCLADKVDNKIKAIACFDLGEFARFFPQGKTILDNHSVRLKMTKLMQSSKSSSEVKKEAITCYQKLLMNSWAGGNDQIRS